MEFQVKITAIGEVRDADGNLISTEPVEFIQVMNEEEVLALRDAQHSQPPA